MYPNVSWGIYPEYSFRLHSFKIRPSDPDYVTKIQEELYVILNENGYDWIKIMKSQNSYQLIAGPIQSLSDIALIIMLISTVVAIIILGLVINLFLKDRINEMAILLSLGEQKKNITMQIFLEIYLIGMVAITLSFGSGIFIGQKLTDQILHNSVDEYIELNSAELEMMEEYGDSLTIEDALNDVKLKFDIQYVIMIYMIGSIVIILSVLIPIRNVLKLEPKKIMFKS